MSTLHTFILAAFVLLLTACNVGDKFRYYHLYLSVEELNGLIEGSPIMSKGMQIGKVAGIEVEDSLTTVDMLIDNDFMVPAGSELRIVTDIDNTTAFLEIQVSHSKKYFSKRDTVPAKSTILFNRDVILEEVEIDSDTMDESLQRLFR